MFPHTIKSQKAESIKRKRKRTHIYMLIALFLITNVLGLLAARPLILEHKIPENEIINEEPTSGIYFFLLMIFAALVLILLYRLRIPFVVRLWFIIAIFSTTLLFFVAFLPFLFALLVVAVLVALRFLYRDWRLRNVLDVFAFAGAGAFFGTMIGLVPAAILLVLAAVYDVFAVNLTKHMVFLAKESLSSDTFMGFLYPRSPGFKKLPDVEPTDETETIKSKVGALGGGDIILPLIFAIAMFKALGLAASLLCISFSTIALYILLVNAQQNKFYPALPPLSLGCFLALLVALLFSFAAGL